MTMRCLEQNQVAHRHESGSYFSAEAENL